MNEIKIYQSQALMEKPRGLITKSIFLILFSTILISCKDENQPRAPLSSKPERWTERIISIDSGEFKGLGNHFEDINRERAVLNPKNPNKTALIRITENYHLGSEYDGQSVEFVFDSASFNSLSLPDNKARSLRYWYGGFRPTSHGVSNKYRLYLNKVDDSLWHVSGKFDINIEIYGKTTVRRLLIDGNFKRL